MGLPLSTIWTVLKYVRAAVILYLVFCNIACIFGIFVVTGIVSLPFGGFRLARKNMQRFPGVFVNAITALMTYFLLNTYFVVYVDEAELKRDRGTSKSTISRICRRFGLNGGKIEEIAEDDSRDIVISNHQIYADWIYLWAFLGLLGRAGNIKIVCKRAIQFIPLVGWGLKLLDFVFLHRNWAVDRLKFCRRVRRIGSYGLPFNLLIFPEGTTMNPGAIRKGQEYAKSNGLPVLKHVLLPRVTGTEAAVNALRQRCLPDDEACGDDALLDGILDLTVGYSRMPSDVIPEEFYGLMSIAVDAHGPDVIHVHASYIPLEEIPSTGDGKEFSGWLTERFHEKDKLLREFYASGKFKGKPSKKVPLSPKIAIWHLAFLVFLFHASVLALVWLFMRK